MNKYINRNFRVVAFIALLLTLSVNLVSLPSADAARGPSRQRCQPGSSIWPQCQGAGIQVNASWPSVGIAGQPFTYTLGLTNGGVQTATNIELDLQLAGDQKLTNFDPGSSGWTLIVPPDQITQTLRISVAGSLEPGKTSPTVTVATTFPDLNQPILRQYATASWNDLNGFTSRGRLMVINVQPPSVQPVSPGGGTVAPVTNPNQPSSLANAALPFVPVANPNPGSTNLYNWYFPVTGHTLNDQMGFLTYWLDHGSVAVLGYPLSEVFTDQSNMQIQYFERGVLEYHPNNPDPYKVELRSLGRAESQAQPAIQQGASPASGSVFYPQTGHWMYGPFVSYWQQNGGLMQFGYPISEPQMETNSSGQTVMTQWFERARFELNYSVTNYPIVQLGLVGREDAVKQGYLPY